jgi:hypothetical protein
MNGYVQFETPDGEPITINADRVSFVRRFGLVQLIERYAIASDIHEEISAVGQAVIHFLKRVCVGPG